MPRLRQVSKADADPFAQQLYTTLFGDRDPIEEPGTATGTPGDWWTVFALAPDIFKHAVDGFGLYRNPDRKLDPQLRELGQTRAGYKRGSQFVFSQHCKSCRSLGISEEKIAAIPSWGASDLFSPVERAILAYTDDLVLSSGRVSDGVFDQLKKHLSDVEIFEFTYITAMYDMHATISRALRLEYDNVEERVVEIAVPEGASDDVMNMVDDQ